MDLRFSSRKKHSLATGVLVMTAMGGVAAGVRGKRPIIQGFVGGMAGLLGGQLTGNAIEQNVVVGMSHRTNKIECLCWNKIMRFAFANH